MGDGYMCGRNVKMKESLSHFCGISFLPKWDFFFCGLHIEYFFHNLLEFISLERNVYAENDSAGQWVSTIVVCLFRRV